VPAWVKWPLTAALATVCLYLVFAIMATGQYLWGSAALVMFAVAFYVYLSNASFAYRYLFPGIAGMLLFVAALPAFIPIPIGGALSGPLVKGLNDFFDTLNRARRSDKGLLGSFGEALESDFLRARLVATNEELERLAPAAQRARPTPAEGTPPP
jgi:hypothetical protein